MVASKLRHRVVMAQLQWRLVLALMAMPSIPTEASPDAKRDEHTAKRDVQTESTTDRHVRPHATHRVVRVVQDVSNQ